MRMKRSKIGRSLLAAALLLAATPLRTPCAAQAAKPEAAPSPGPPSDWRSTIARVARECGPSVVHIEVTDRKEVRGRPEGGQGDRPSEPFFGRPDAPRAFKEGQKGLGSGMILDANGNILTNAHVVAGAARIEVSLSSGERQEATVVGSDPKTDLAVIRIPGRPTLRPVTFGDSDLVEVGEWVVAIGHPRGLDHTVTQGIISAKHRRGITDPTSYADFLQTDAAINLGNSGGPLLNLKGQVIGVNAMISSTSGGSEGIGFAIPSNMAAHITRQLIANGKVSRGWLGVTSAPLTPELAQELKLGSVTGALIGGVVDGGPAARAGIRAGQVVVAFDGKPVDSDLDLRNRTAAAPAGSTVPVRVIENGRARDLAVTVGDLAVIAKQRLAAAESRLGVSVREITVDETKLYRLKPGSGVVVTAVDPNGPAAGQGMEAGDVIVEIQGQSVDNTEVLGMVAMLLPSGAEVALLAVDHRTGEAGYLRIAPR